ncbi:hypothetical protein NM688_g7151 [Phlebia brevispora]|uniref:Uncharacterized protein n=1 Tax=Phlebia brevispora TaxID=194682 RepID=A0ACC1S8G9_9APHY|nr:hypothetical protein NM688_g7151 [Phlebia brevispora]
MLWMDSPLRAYASDLPLASNHRSSYTYFMCKTVGGYVFRPPDVRVSLVTLQIIETLRAASIKTQTIALVQEPSPYGAFCLSRSPLLASSHEYCYDRRVVAPIKSLKIMRGGNQIPDFGRRGEARKRYIIDGTLLYLSRSFGCQKLHLCFCTFISVREYCVADAMNATEVAQYETSIRLALISNHAAHAAATIASYEYISGLQFELLMWRRKWTGATWVFIANRCTSVIIPVLVGICTRAPTVVAAVFSALRVFALSNRSYFLCILILSIGLVPVITNIYNILTTAWMYSDENCLGNSKLSASTIGIELATRLSTVIVDVLVVAITWMKTYQQVRQAASLGIQGISRILLVDVYIFCASLYLLPSFHPLKGLKQCHFLFNLVEILGDVWPAFFSSKQTFLALNTVQPILISWFIINLRRADENNKACGSGLASLSHFSALHFHAPTGLMESIIGPMGGPVGFGEHSIWNKGEDIVADELYDRSPGREENLRSSVMRGSQSDCSLRRRTYLCIVRYYNVELITWLDAEALYDQLIPSLLNLVLPSFSHFRPLTEHLTCEVSMENATAVAEYTTNFRADLVAVHVDDIAITLAVHEYILGLVYEVLIWRHKWTGVTWIFTANRCCMLLSVLVRCASPVVTVLIAICVRSPTITAAGAVALATRLSSVVVDCIVVGITWRKTYQQAKESISLGLHSASQILLLDGSIYFLFMMILNSLQIATDVLCQPSLTNVQVTSDIFNTLQAILISRFIINLRYPNGSNDDGHSNFASISTVRFRIPRGLSDSIIGPMDGSVGFGEQSIWEERESFIGDGVGVKSIGNKLKIRHYYRARYSSSYWEYSRPEVYYTAVDPAHDIPCRIDDHIQAGQKVASLAHGWVRWSTTTTVALE